MMADGDIEDRARLHDAASATGALPRTPLRRQVVEAALGRGSTVAGSNLEEFLESTDPAQIVARWFGTGVSDLASRSEPGALRRMFDRDIAALDTLLNDQVDAILHHADFQKMEAAWRGVSYLLDAAEADERVRVRLLSMTWEELGRDFDRAAEFDQSQLFTKVYSEEYGTPGGLPFGLLVCDYAVRHRRLAGMDAKVDDITAIAALSQVAAAAFAPCVIGAAPELFGVENFAELSYVQNFEAGFVGPEYQRWRRLQQREESRFVGLVLPRMLLRDGWKDDGARKDGFRYREGGSGRGVEDWLWGNGVYAFGAVAIRAFRDWGWFADIRGTRVDNDDAGLITGLPAPHFSTNEASVYRRPLEVELADKKQKALEELGFITLSPCRMTPFAAFLGMQSAHVAPAALSVVEAANARLSSMLQYVLCVSRFAHYVKVMARDRVGAYTTAAELEKFLGDWLRRYMIGNDDASFELKARHPLSGGGVEVSEILGKPGSFACTVHLQPHFQIDQVVTAFRLQTEVQGLKAA